MAASKFHFRSISLPSRLHPINSTGFKSDLQKLNYCLSKNAPIISETIQSGLLGLAELYNSVGKLTQNLHDAKSNEDSLESSIQLLDYCNTIRELVQMIRENVQALQSGLRRNQGLNPAMQNDINSYFCFRKKMNKRVAKILKTLKNLENKINGSNVLPSEAAFVIFRGILVFLSFPAGKYSGGWKLVSRLMTAKSLGRDDVAISEVGCVDSVLNALIRNGESCKVVDLQMVQRSLRNLDACVEGIEAGLQRLFRQLLQSRVALLNNATDH